MRIRSSRAPLLILAHLGLIPFAACKPDAHVTDPTVGADVAPTTATTATEATPTGTASAADTAVATGTALAIGTATATAGATASASSTGAKLGPGECLTDRDCPPYAECIHVAPEPPAKTAVNHCHARANYQLGRPLVVDGQAHVAAYVSPASPASDPASLAESVETLLEAARSEHASIAAFARTLSELMALGAPAWLLLETQAALADEIKHTEMTLDLLERATGERPLLGPLAAAVAPLRSGPHAASELFRDVFRGGAVGETLAAARAETERDTSDERGDEMARSFYDTLFHDEARHAALAFKTLRWLLGQDASLAAVLEQERARFERDEPFAIRTLVGPLLAHISA